MVLYPPDFTERYSPTAVITMMMTQNTLRFSDNGKFKIMQITDTQEVFPVSPDTVKLLRLAIAREKPDLAVFTGDQIYGVMPCFRGKTRNMRVRAVFSEIFEPFEEAGIPFAVTFGNHDRQCGLSNTEQAEIISRFPHNISGASRDADDRGTFSLPVFSSDGLNKLFNIYLIDSNTSAKSGGYEPVFPEQIEWYKKERDRLERDCGGVVPSLVFQHIPLPEYFDILKTAKRGTKGAVEAFRTHKNEFYVLPDDAIACGGFMRESPAVPDVNTGEFSTMTEKGDVMGIYVGHDHINSFEIKKDGVTLAYTQGAGFNVYGPGRERGVRIFDIDESSPREFKTHTLTFGELTNDKLSSPMRDIIYKFAPTSIEQVKKYGAFLAAGSVFGGAVFLACRSYIGKRNK